MNLNEAKRRNAGVSRIDRRSQIQQMAVEVFARKGFPESSLQDIADELGIKREAIYYYFRSKKEILLSVILEPSRAMLEAAVAIADSDQPARTKFERALRSHLEHFSPAYLEVSVALRHSTLTDDEDFVELKQQWKDYERIWVGIVRQGQADGTFNQSLDAKVAAYALLGMCNWLSRWYRPDGEVGLEALIENFQLFAAHGLLKPRA